MELAMENGELTRVYDNQTEAWKTIKKDASYNKQMTKPIPTCLAVAFFHNSPLYKEPAMKISGFFQRSIPRCCTTTNMGFFWAWWMLLCLFCIFFQVVRLQHASRYANSIKTDMSNKSHNL